MGLENGILTQPISVYDIANCIGVASTDVGTLCSANAKINIWAKYKPVRYNKIGSLTENERKACAYGLLDTREYDLSSDTAITTAFDNALNRIYSWEYESPTGGNASLYRMLDFDGYNHNAICPLFFEDNSPQWDKVEVRVGSIADAALPQGNITLSDLQELSTIVNADNSTGFGLLYKKDNNAVRLVGLDVERNCQYPCFNSSGEALTHSITLEGKGIYTIVPIIIAPSHGLFATLPLKAIIKEVRKKPASYEIYSSLSGVSKFSVIVNVTANEEIAAQNMVIRVYPKNDANYYEETIPIPILAKGKSYTAITDKIDAFTISEVVYWTITYNNKITRFTNS